MNVAEEVVEYEDKLKFILRQLCHTLDECKETCGIDFTLDAIRVIKGGKER